MSKYQLISFDMDGTLLNSKKQITPGVLESLKVAVEKGKSVCLSTGRSVSELQEFKTLIPGLRYANCCSGAMVYDFEKEEALFRQTMPIETVRLMFEISKGSDCAMQIISKECVLEKRFQENLEHYHMDVYREHFENSATFVDDFIQAYEENPYPIEKINFYHATPEDLAYTREQFLASGLPLVMVRSEETGLEFSPQNTDKGVGLRELSKIIGVPLSDIIAVGDAENDLAALTISGLGIAMGNANDAAKAKADVVVADCDHDGAAEAIYKYLLAE